jgi:uncharacterized protein (DUF39 family)
MGKMKNQKVLKIMKEMEVDVKLSILEYNNNHFGNRIINWQNMWNNLRVKLENENKSKRKKQ